MPKEDLQIVFAALKQLLAKHGKDMEVVTDTADNYYLNTGKRDDKGKPVFFASAKIGKDKVSFYLMPVYCHPELLEDITPALKKRMQGKSCFNFANMDQALFAELEQFVKNGRAKFKAEGTA
jgi:hypothetical protein